MIVAPCSAKTLAAIAHGVGENLIHRAADVVLKERRKLVLAVREAPLSDIHLENMLKLSRMGAVMLPPMPAFYTHPQSLDDVVTTPWRGCSISSASRCPAWRAGPGRWAPAAKTRGRVRYSNSSRAVSTARSASSTTCAASAASAAVLRAACRAVSAAAVAFSSRASRSFFSVRCP